MFVSLKNFCDHVFVNFINKIKNKYHLIPEKKLETLMLNISKRHKMN